MGAAHDRWAEAGRTPLRLPSGLVIAGVWPSISDLVRRGLMPWGLRKAVLANTGKKPAELTDQDVAANLEHRLRLAAAFVRSLLNEDTLEWEPLTITFEDLEGLPGDDVEALDTFVFMAVETGPAQAAWYVTFQSEVELGLRTSDDADSVNLDHEQEAAATVAAWADFRDESGGEAAGAARPDVGPEAVADPRPNRAARRAATRRRSSSAPAP